MAMIINRSNDLKVPAYNLYLDPETQIHISDGNDKMGKGVYNISLLPGSGYLRFKGTGKFCKGKLLTNIKGTCGGVCEKCKCMKECYAIKALMHQHNTCTKAWGENTLLAREDRNRFFSELDRFMWLNLVLVFRWHVSGEIMDEEYFFNMIQLAEKHPETQFYVYTKAYKIVETVGKDMEGFKENFHVLVSIWHKNYSNPFGLPEFIYDDGTEPELEIVPHCPAVNKDGKETGVTCATCRRCWHVKNGDKIAVYAH